MDTKIYFSKDFLLHTRNCVNGFVISNIRSKTHFKINNITFYLLGEYVNGNYDCNKDAEWSIEDITLFSQAYSLMADPSCINDEELDNFNERNSSSYAIDKLKRDVVVYKGKEAVIEALIKAKILIEDKETYKDFFKPKENLFDTRHIGNFHQQVGFNLMMKYKIAPDKFWTSQKFKDGEVLDNLYRYIQLDFFNNYFGAIDLKGKKVLDVGCGTGYYSKLLLQKGANVVGIDPNEGYINIAKNNCKEFEGVVFIKGTIEEDVLENEKFYNSFDFIFISDMLLFYFVSPDPKYQNSPIELLAKIRKYLKDDGLLYITEPHGVFWLMLWLGSEDFPYTIVSEYANKVQKVTPTLQEASQVFKKSGYHIKEIFEPKPSVECKEKYSKRTYHFATEFPLWWVFILGKER